MCSCDGEATGACGRACGGPRLTEETDIQVLERDDGVGRVRSCDTTCAGGCATCAEDQRVASANWARMQSVMQGYGSAFWTAMVLRREFEDSTGHSLTDGQVRFLSTLGDDATVSRFRVTPAPNLAGRDKVDPRKSFDHRLLTRTSIGVEFRVARLQGTALPDSGQWNPHSVGAVPERPFARLERTPVWNWSPASWMTQEQRGGRDSFRRVMSSGASLGPLVVEPFADGDYGLDLCETLMGGVPIVVEMCKAYPVLGFRISGATPERGRIRLEGQA